MDQVHKNAIGGFIPNSNDADVDFGRCLQCAAVDRARMLSWVDRSAFCADCFAQYCYDPANPPHRDMIPDRKRSFVDPDPQDVHDFIEKNKNTIIVAGLVCGLLIILVTACWCVHFHCFVLNTLTMCIVYGAVAVEDANWCRRPTFNSSQPHRGFH